MANTKTVEFSVTESDYLKHREVCYRLVTESVKQSTPRSMKVNVSAI